MLKDIENRSRLSRVTCGWKKPHLPLDWVRRYWRDVHSPAIARRDGIYDYRHMQFDAVRADLFPPVAGIDFTCPADRQLMWLSDVRYLGDDELARFGMSPDGDVKAQLLGDIELIVDKSTTYRAVGADAETLLDETGVATPAGPASHPTFNLFFRARSVEAPFRAAVTGLAHRWASAPGVLRLRLSLFEVPDMEAEKKAGYPIKTHPLDLQYQAWVELVLEDDAAAKGLLSQADGLAEDVAVIHAYPTPVVYTFVYDGRPTLIGLRGYPAYEAIEALGGYNHTDIGLLRWMYGPAVSAGPFTAGDR